MSLKILEKKTLSNVSVNTGLWIISNNLMVRKLATSRWPNDAVFVPFQDLPPRLCCFFSVYDCQGEIHVPEVDLPWKKSPRWNICVINMYLCLTFHQEEFLRSILGSSLNAECWKAPLFSIQISADTWLTTSRPSWSETLAETDITIDFTAPELFLLNQPCLSLGFGKLHTAETKCNLYMFFNLKWGGSLNVRVCLWTLANVLISLLYIRAAYGHSKPLMLVWVCKAALSQSRRSACRCLDSFLIQHWLWMRSRPPHNLGWRRTCSKYLISRFFKCAALERLASSQLAPHPAFNIFELHCNYLWLLLHACLPTEAPACSNKHWQSSEVSKSAHGRATALNLSTHELLLIHMQGLVAHRRVSVRAPVKFAVSPFRRGDRFKSSLNWPLNVSLTRQELTHRWGVGSAWAPTADLLWGLGNQNESRCVSEEPSSD